MKFGIQMESLIGGLSSFLIGLISIFGCHYLAKYTNMFDKPDQIRKFHLRVTPNSGGIGIALAYIIGLLIVGLIAFQTASEELIGFIPYFSAGLLLVVGLGLFDDIKGVSFRSKFLIQIIAAVITCIGLELVYMGEILSQTGFGSGTIILFKAGLYTIFTVWIVAIVNSMNLIDGVDGLASVLALLVILGLSIVGIFWDATEYSLIVYPLAGAVFAFLLFNRPPAYIFMGDTGSLLIGYVLGTVTLLMAIQSNHWMYGVSLVFLFAIPLLDTLFAIIRRKVNNISPFESDSNHIHHVIQRYYRSPGKTILVIGSIGLLLTVITIVLATTADPLLFYLLFGLTAVAFSIVVLVYYMNVKKYSVIIKTGTDTVKSKKGNPPNLWRNLSNIAALDNKESGDDN